MVSRHPNLALAAARPAEEGLGRSRGSRAGEGQPSGKERGRDGRDEAQLVAAEERGWRRRRRRPGSGSDCGAARRGAARRGGWGRIPGPGGEGGSRRPGHGGQREAGQPAAQEFQEQRPRLGDYETTTK